MRSWRRLSKHDVLIILLIFLAVTSLIFVMFDRWYGETVLEVGVVVGHRYIPESEHTYTTEDADGNIKEETITYPEQWILDVRDQFGKVWPHGCYKSTYYSYRDDEECIVVLTVGGFTRWRYFDGIRKMQPGETK